jgi:hypothetical protein
LPVLVLCCLFGLLFCLFALPSRFGDASMRLYVSLLWYLVFGCNLLPGCGVEKYINKLWISYCC